MRVDPFGRKGDFITSPEVSQVFGELVGIWLVTEWMAQTQSPKRLRSQTSTGRTANIESDLMVQLVELGPGRGTLMADILRTVAGFKTFAASIEGVYLVEASETLRESQRQTLCGDDAPMTRTETGWQSLSKAFGDRTLPIVWVEDISLLPKPRHAHAMPLIVAHEFLDALPIHVFEAVPTMAAQGSSDHNHKPTSRLGGSSDKRQDPLSLASGQQSSVAGAEWRELLVDSSPPVEDPSQLSASPILTQEEMEKADGGKQEKLPPPDFHFVRSKSATPISHVLTNSSPRYRALLSQPGSVIEISSESQSCVSGFAQRIGKGKQSLNPSFPITPNNKPHSTIESKTNRLPSGAALIIDYGTETIPRNTLRAIKSHRRLASPFILPGQADISADVDFTALAEAASLSDTGVEIWGPVPQGQFLHVMGGQERVENLCQAVMRDGDHSKTPSGRARGEQQQQRKREEDRVESEKEEENEKEGKERARRKDAIQAGWKRLVDMSEATAGSGGGMGRIYKVMAIVPDSGGRRPPVGFGGGVVGG